MKGIVLILSLFLSCVFSGTGQEYGIAETGLHETVTASTDGNEAEKKGNLNDFAVLPARAASYSGTGNGFAPSVRSTNTGRRVQPSAKYALRIIKAGKVFDRNNFQAFQAVLLRFPSGIHSTGRYLHSICCLLI